VRLRWALSRYNNLARDGGAGLCIGFRRIMSLDLVHDEDKPIVRNMVVGIQALKKERVFATWSVAVDEDGAGYLVTANVVDGVDVEFGSRELDVLHDISPLRVLSVSAGRVGGRFVVNARISSRSAPLTMTETQIVHVRKRTRWMLPSWLGGGGGGGDD